MINQEMLTGTVERITYYNPENGYSVIKIQPDGKYPNAAARDGTVAVVGTMPEIAVGETVQFTGNWIEDPRYGKQFRAETVTPIMPSSADGIINYLSSGIVKGIGPKTAEKIVNYFGEKTIHILDNEPEKLYDIPGIKKELIKGLVRAWADNQAVRQTMIFLQGYGVTSRMAARIYNHYGAATINKVQSDPFSLADEVFGIGFIRADEIARSMGVEPDDPNRIRAGIHFALNQMSKDGHTYAPRTELVAKTAELLKIANTERIQATIASELFRGDLIGDSAVDGGEAIYLPVYYYSER